MAQLRASYGLPSKIEFNISMFGYADPNTLSVEGVIIHPMVGLTFLAKKLETVWVVEIPVSAQALLEPNVEYPFVLRVNVGSNFFILPQEQIIFVEEPKPQVSALKVQTTAPELAVSASSIKMTTEPTPDVTVPAGSPTSPAPSANPATYESKKPAPKPAKPLSEKDQLFKHFFKK